MRVWDPLVRLGHWALVASVAAAWLTRHGGGLWHEWIGYAALAIVGLRILWGWVGSPYARFAQFVRAPSATLTYARAMLARTEPRYLGHNPPGGWMILALLAAVIAVGLSGWLYTTDTYWGVEWVERLHDTLADILLILVAVHVGGVIFASRRHRENLVAAMIHGRKRPAEPGEP
ncbi:MAG: cytochrome B [Rhodospirillaceae bacterium]|nr:cytochrome B [Rhodospirillaceae bacterium]